MSKVIDKLNRAIDYYSTSSNSNIHLNGAEVINIPFLLKDLYKELESKNKEIERLEAVVDAAKESKQALMIRSTVTQCHATQHEIGVLRRLAKALANLKEQDNE